MLAGLANDPNFQQLRNAVRQNPQMLQSILAVIAQSNPQLFNVKREICDIRFLIFKYSLSHKIKKLSLD